MNLKAQLQQQCYFILGQALISFLPPPSQALIASLHIKATIKKNYNILCSNKLMELTFLGGGANSRIYAYGQGQQQVVLKTVPATYPKQQKHLKNQFQVLQRLSHRHVVRSLRYRQNVVFLGNKTDKQLKPSPTSNILVLQYASKNSLLHYLKQKPDIGSKRRAFRQIASALAYLHSLGIAHRDLKLDNILVFQQGGQVVFKVSDLGLASTFKQAENVLRFNEFKGTRKGYMAPQIHQCLKDRSKQYDASKTDIFALGVILFALVFQTLPFQYALPTDSYYKKIMQKQFTTFWNCHNVTKLQQLENVRLQELKALFEKMVSSDPQQRPAIEEVLNNGWLLEGTSKAI